MTSSSQRLVALSGIVGPVILIASFILNPAPPANATIPQLRAFAIQHHDAIVLGGWLQGIGSSLMVVFAIGVVHLADAANRMAGWLTLFAGTLIVMVSLVEVTFYLGAVQGTESGDTASALASGNLIKAVQHVFLIAPALLLPLSFVLRGSTLLPRLFAQTALALGVVLQTLGLLGLFNLLQTVIDVLLVVQAGWFVAAASVLLLRGRSMTAALLATPFRGG